MKNKDCEIIVTSPGKWVKTSQLLKLLLPSKYAPSIWKNMDKEHLRKYEHVLQMILFFNQMIKPWRCISIDLQYDTITIPDIWKREPLHFVQICAFQISWKELL